MSSFNKITIVGYLGRDPELRYTPQGKALCKLSIATTEKRKDPATGEQEEHTTWFRVTAWERQAELAAKFLSKGRQVYVEGRLRLEEYVDRDGQKRVSAEVSATEIQFMGNGQGINSRHALSDKLTQTSDDEGSHFAGPVEPTQPHPHTDAAVEQYTAIHSVKIDDETNGQSGYIKAEGVPENAVTTEGLVTDDVTDGAQSHHTEPGTALTLSAVSDEPVVVGAPEISDDAPSTSTQRKRKRKAAAKIVEAVSVPREGNGSKTKKGRARVMS